MGGATIPIALGAMSLFGQNQAAKAQKDAARPAKTIAGMQKNLFAQTQPYYAPILQLLAQRAGVQMPGGGLPPLAKGGTGTTPGGPGPAGSLTPHLPMGTTAMPENQLGIFGQGEDRLRFAQAEEELERIRRQRNAELLLGLTRQGAGAATTSAALARNEGQYQEGLADFRRNLAINAGDEQARRAQALLSALSPGFGLGQSAAGILGDQAGLAANRANAMGQATGDALSNYLLYQAMRRQQPAAPPAGGGYVPPAGGGWIFGRR